MFPAAVPAATAAYGAAKPVFMKWLLPILIGMAGGHLRRNSDGMAGQVAGGLMEIGGLGKVGHTLGQKVGAGVTSAIGKLAPKSPKWVTQNAANVAEQTAQIAPFGLSIAAELAGQEIPRDPDVDPQMMMAIQQMLMETEGQHQPWVA